MSEPSRSCRRREDRTNAALTARFSVNDGPEYFSDTINFSLRSLAIRTDLPVRAGDRVRAMIEHFPPIDGVVARVWDEGFAVSLDEATMTPEAIAREACARDCGIDHDLASALVGGPVSGRLSRLEAPHASWFSITAAGPSPSTQQRRLLVVTTAPLDRETLFSTWISVAGTRWLVRPIDARNRDGQSILMMRINEWQMQKAAEFGLTFTAILKSLHEWSAEASAEAVAAHLEPTTYAAAEPA